MKLKTFALALAATTIAGSALAADLPSRKVAPAYVAPVPVFTWTGFYIGLNAGYAFGGSNSVNSIGAPVGGAGPFGVAQGLAFGNTYSAPASTKGGFTFGGQAGYNYQMGSLVAGIETDIQGIFGGGSGSTIVTTAPVPGFPAESYSAAILNRRKIDWFGTLRGRLGFTVAPTFLLYATGGLAYGGVKLNNNYVGWNPVGGYTVPATGGGAASGTRLGWTVGAGGEWAFAPNWSAKLEYLYYDLGTLTASTFVSQNNPAIFWAGSANTVSAKFNGHVVRAGLNYKFGWGGAAPVVAKY